MLFNMHRFLINENCSYNESDDRVMISVFLIDSEDFGRVYSSLYELMNDYENGIVVQNVDDFDIRSQFIIDNKEDLNSLELKYKDAISRAKQFTFEIVLNKMNVISAILNKVNLDALKDNIFIKVYFDMSFFKEKFFNEKSTSDLKKYSIHILSCQEDVNLRNKWSCIINDFRNLQFDDVKDNINNFNENYNKTINKQVKLRQSLTKIIGKHDETSPEFYYFQFPIGSNIVLSVLRHKFIKQVLLYISKETYVDKDKVEYGLFGFKNVTFQYEKDWDIDEETYNKLYRFFDYIYNDYTDVKFEILPNILSFYIIHEENQLQQFISNIDKIYNSLKSNFNIHAQERIKFWFEERKKIIDYISSKTDQISSLIDNHIKIFSNTIIALVITILGSVFQNASQSKIEFLKLSLLIYFYFGIVYYVYNFVISVVSFIMSIADFKHFIINESRLLSEDEVNDLIGSVILRKKYFYIISVAVSTLIFAILFYNIYYFYSHFELIRLFFINIK